MRAALTAAVAAAVSLSACTGAAPLLPVVAADPVLDARPLTTPAIETLNTECRAPDPALATQMLASINAERERLGRSLVTLDPALTEAAQSHACDMVRQGRLTVVGSNGNSVLDRSRAVGRTVCAAANTVGRGDPATLVTRWSRDKTTRDGIVDQKFNSVGVGVVSGPGGLWWSINSGRAC